MATPSVKIRDSSSYVNPVKKELNEEGRKNLCMALKREYDIYLSLLVHAKNLSSNKDCPWLDISLPMMSEGEYRNEHGIKSTKMFNNL